MRKFKNAAGYAWAATALLILLGGLSNMDNIARAMIAAGITVSPLFSGGEVTRMTDRDGYRNFQYRPVFDALIGETREGFIQLEWQGSLPAVLQETVPLYNDAASGFTVRLSTAVPAAELTAPGKLATGIRECVKTEQGIIVRVTLRNPAKIQPTPQLSGKS